MAHKIAVIGATNQTGREVLTVIDERNVPVEKLYAVDINSQFGQEVSYGEDSVITVEKLESFDFSKVDVVINASGSAKAQDIASKAKAAGARLIDISSAYRMDPDTPLIVPDVNGSSIKDQSIIASPNCMVTGITAALKPLHDIAGINRIHAVTYQSVSGAGKDAMDELFNQTRAIFVADPIEPNLFPKQIAFNVIPQIGKFMDDRQTSEEFAIKAETKKILGTKIKVTATAVRVPIFVGHSAALHLDFDKEISALDALEALRQTRGITVIDLENEELEYMTPQEVQGEDDVYVSRIREDSGAENGLCLWISLDNIHRGLAVNAVQILELL